MPDSCDVEGCTGTAIVDLLSKDEGYRCRNCMETDLNVRTVR